MTIQVYLFCFIAGLLGILAHIFWLKLPALKAASKAANIPFSLSGYFRDDWISLVSSFLAVVIAAFVLDEITKHYPIVAEWVKWVFIFIGYTGSSILQTALGKTQDKINQVVDVKTDIADGKTK